jgi:hypothetical protein
VLVGDEVAFAAFSFLFNFHVVQVDRWGQPNRKHLQNDFLEADYLLAKPKRDSYLGRITPALIFTEETYISHFGTRINRSIYPIIIRNNGYIQVGCYFIQQRSRMELPKCLLHVSNVLITRQLQKANCVVNFGEHAIVFMLECARKLAHDHTSPIHDASRALH